MTLAGEPYSPAGPDAARRAGVSMIYQELTLAPHLTVEENVFLGMETSRWGFARRGRQEARVAEALALLGHADIAPRARAGSLSLGAQQLVEVARAIVARARLIVLDEPTSSLTRQDVERLFQVIARLRAAGVSLIYISHFLEEVERIADRFTVLREGATAGAGAVRATPTARIIEMMVGRSLGEFFPRVPHARGEPVLAIRDLRGRRLPRGIDLTLHRGEILGIAGLIGAGRTETLRAVYGLDPLAAGTVTVAGIGGLESAVARARRGTSAAARVRQGLGLLSENRKEEGLALGLSIAENVTLSALGKTSILGWLAPARERRQVQAWAERLRIACRSPSQAAVDLSGGNQQKVAIARLLHQGADVLLLDEPTRGIDVGSKVEVYRLMGELAAAGKAVLFVSSYLPELLGVADRIAVMARGRLSEVRDAAAWDEQSILACATGGEAA
jgi:ribose transport system ATP-binding protein